MIAILGILALAFFSFGLKETALKGMAKENPGYNCDENSFCTSCMINGNTCRCGEQVCDCGEMTVDKEECELF